MIRLGLDANASSCQQNRPAQFAGRLIVSGIPRPRNHPAHSAQRVVVIVFTPS
jgi:hypothetical protein